MTRLLLCGTKRATGHPTKHEGAQFCKGVRKILTPTKTRFTISAPARGAASSVNRWIWKKPIRIFGEFESHPSTSRFADAPFEAPQTLLANLIKKS